MAELKPIIVFHGRRFVHHLGIFNPLGVKLLQILSGIIMRNLENDVFISNRLSRVHKRGIHTDTDIHTHSYTRI